MASGVRLRLASAELLRDGQRLELAPQHAELVLDVGGVEQRHAELERAPDRADRLVLVHLAPAGGLAGGRPRAADRPAAEPERADLRSRPGAEIASEHG